jgi:hypothetical protein
VQSKENDMHPPDRNLLRVGEVGGRTRLDAQLALCLTSEHHGNRRLTSNANSI